MSRRLFTLAILALLAGTSPTTALAEPVPDVSYPIDVVPGSRYLVDDRGVPFLLHGDSPWSLIVQLTLEEAEQYLDDRRAKGFNTVLVNLIEHAFSDDPPNNRYGEPPFLVPGDFSTPNEAYFAHADRVIRAAAERDIQLLLAPVYLGYACGNQGWCQEVLQNDLQTMHDWGRYVGARYRESSNLIWILGGDTDPGPAREHVRQVALGILAEDQRHLLTAHAAPEQSAVEAWPGEPWLDLNNTYTYGLVHAKSRTDYERDPISAFFLLESNYENEHGSTAQWIRRQAYWSILSGSTGDVMGNRPIWLFDNGWQAALDQPGSISMAHLWDLIAPRPWYLWVPDHEHTVLVSGYGDPDGYDYATAALGSDGRTLLAYLPTPRTLEIDMTNLAGPVTARWFDPSDGSYTTLAGSPFPNVGIRSFTPASTNADGFGDWVLVLEATEPAFDVLRLALSGVDPPPMSQLPLDPVRDLYTVAVDSPVRISDETAALIYYAVPEATTLVVESDGADVLLYFYF